MYGVVYPHSPNTKASARLGSSGSSASLTHLVLKSPQSLFHFILTRPVTVLCCERTRPRKYGMKPVAPNGFPRQDRVFDPESFEVLD